MPHPYRENRAALQGERSAPGPARRCRRSMSLAGPPPGELRTPRTHGARAPRQLQPFVGSTRGFRPHRSIAPERRSAGVVAGSPASLVAGTNAPPPPLAGATPSRRTAGSDAGSDTPLSSPPPSPPTSAAPAAAPPHTTAAPSASAPPSSRRSDTPCRTRTFPRSTSASSSAPPSPPPSSPASSCPPGLPAERHRTGLQVHRMLHLVQHPRLPALHLPDPRVRIHRLRPFRFHPVFFFLLRGPPASDPPASASRSPTPAPAGAETPDTPPRWGIAAPRSPAASSRPPPASAPAATSTPAAASEPTWPRAPPTSRFRAFDSVAQFGPSPTNSGSASPRAARRSHAPGTLPQQTEVALRHARPAPPRRVELRQTSCVWSSNPASSKTRFSPR